MIKMTKPNVSPVFNTGYVPLMPTGFGEKYRGPFFDADDGTGTPDPAQVEREAAAAAAATKKAAEDAAKLAAGAGSTGTTEAEAKLLKEVMAKKREAQEAKDALAALKAQFDDVDPEEFKKLKKAQKDAEEEALRAKGDFDALKNRMAEEHTRELNAERKKAKEVQDKLDALNQTVRGLTVGSAFTSSKFLNEDTILPPAIAKIAYDGYFEVENGQVVGYDAPRGATNRVAMVSGIGTPLPFDEVLKRIVEASPDKDKVLKSKRVAGAGGSNMNVGIPGQGETNPNPNNGAYSPGTNLAKIAKNLGTLGRGNK